MFKFFNKLPFRDIFGLFVIVSILCIIMGHKLTHNILLIGSCQNLVKEVTMDYRITYAEVNQQKNTCVIKKQYPETKGDTSPYRKYQTTQETTEYPMAEFDKIQYEIYSSVKRFKDLNYLK